MRIQHQFVFQAPKEGVFFQWMSFKLTVYSSRYIHKEYRDVEAIPLLEAGSCGNYQPS